MNRAEILAFNAGVEAVLDLATSSARALEPQLALKPTRIGFAHSALTAVAEEGRALLMPLAPHGHGEAGSVISPEPPKSPNSSAAAAELASIEG